MSQPATPEPTPDQVPPGMAGIWTAYIRALESDAHSFEVAAAGLERAGAHRTAAGLRREATAARAIAAHLRAGAPHRAEEQEATDA